jgi:hypothetical protein
VFPARCCAARCPAAAFAAEADIVTLRFTRPAAWREASRSLCRLHGVNFISVFAGCGIDAQQKRPPVVKHVLFSPIGHIAIISVSVRSVSLGNSHSAIYTSRR